MLPPPFPLSFFVHFPQRPLPVLGLDFADLLRFPPSRAVPHEVGPLMKWLQGLSKLREHPKTSAQVLHEFVDEDMPVVCESSE